MSCKLSFDCKCPRSIFADREDVTYEGVVTVSEGVNDNGAHS
jgi:hypothetical protein